METFRRQYFTCSIRTEDESWLLEIADTLKMHIMHQGSKQKGVFHKVKPGAVAFLYAFEGLVAYGLVEEVFPGNVPLENIGDWNYAIKVKEWVWCNPSDHKSGVSTYRISDHLPNGASQFATIKEVDEEFALTKMKEINPHSELFTQITAHINKIKQIKSMIYEYSNIMELKKNVILQGAPGTGKTYTTAALAVRICNPGFIDLHDRTKVMREYQRLSEAGQIGFCTFHQSMDYDNFVEGLRPVPVKDTSGNTTGMEYKVEDGIFKQMCTDALDNLRTQSEGKEAEDISAIFEGYCSQIETQLQNLKDEGLEEGVELHPKSKMYIRRINRTSNGTARGLTIAAERDGSAQSISKRIFMRDYLNFKKGLIKAYTDIKPAYKSQSLFHGNAIYYFALYHKIQEFESQHGTHSPIHEGRKKYVLIIDEINRGNVSRIFGELITLLEADKREKAKGSEHISVRLPYSSSFSNDDEEAFSVPENLYLIGTMNSTDKSTGSIDYAVRRRFAFITLESRRDTVDEWYEANGVPTSVREAALAIFDEINGCGTNDPDSFIHTHKCADIDLEDLKVGHSYFMAKDLETLKLKMRYEVVPLLKEYIKDGVLQGRDGDTSFFQAWENGSSLKATHPSVSLHSTT